MTNNNTATALTPASVAAHDNGRSTVWDSAAHRCQVLLGEWSPCCNAPLVRPRGSALRHSRPFACSTCGREHPTTLEVVNGARRYRLRAALPSCDVCEDDHASVVLADGTTVCARDGIDQ